MPLLAICRGCQILNVGRGGTLVPHLPLDEGESHGQLAYPLHTRVHGLEIVPGGLLDGVLDAGVHVNSFHHQAIAELGDGVAVAARASDGVIEGRERRSPSARCAVASGVPARTAGPDLRVARRRCEPNENAAGIVTMSSFDDVTEEEWDRVVDVNMKGYFLVTKATVDALARADGAAIVNITTIESEIVCSTTGHCQVHYNASKGGALMLTKALAAELAGRGIRVNAVAPGATNTLFTGTSFAEPEVFATFADRLLIKRVGEPEDMAAAVSFLLSDDASYITGIQLPVHGGWLVR